MIFFLITGCSGFIGNNLTKKLLKNKNHYVFGIDDLSSGNNLKKFKHNRFKFIKGNCADIRVLNKINKKISYIYHLAGQSSGEKSYYDPLDNFRRNLVTTINLLDYSTKIKCKRFIYASSMAVYGNNNNAKETDNLKPISFYGLSKNSSEEFVKKYYTKGNNYTICRIFNVYGINQKLNNDFQGLIRIYLTQLKNSNTLRIKGNKNRIRDFIDIEDIVEMLAEIPFNKKLQNEVVNLGTGIKTKISDIIELIKKNLRPNLKVKYLKGTPHDQYKIVSNISKSKKLFHFFKNKDFKKINFFFKTLKKKIK